MMTRALLKLRADGVQIDPDAVAALSSYIRPHITRLRRYMLDLSRTPPPVDYDLPSSARWTQSALTTGAAADD
jgi:hypothetical protein